MEFEVEGIKFKFVGGRRYLGGIWVPGKSLRHGCGPKWRHGPMVSEP